jgi:hypothetical protein
VIQYGWGGGRLAVLVYGFILTLPRILSRVTERVLSKRCFLLRLGLNSIWGDACSMVSVSSAYEVMVCVGETLLLDLVVYGWSRREAVGLGLWSAVSGRGGPPHLTYPVDPSAVEVAHTAWVCMRQECRAVWPRGRDSAVAVVCTGGPMRWRYLGGGLGTSVVWRVQV